MAHRIQPGWRYSLAQLCLRLIFGRKWHFISPWKASAVGTAVVLLSLDGKRTLIQQRAGAIEHVGKWGMFGGYLDLEHQEEFADGLTRELREEARINVNPASFDVPDWVNLVYDQPKNELWQHTGVGVWFFRTVPDDFIDRLKTSDEVSAYKWVTEKELHAMWNKGQIAGRVNDHYGGACQAFAAVKLHQFPALQLAE